MLLKLLWLLPVLPFLGALLNGVFLRGRISKRAVAWIACGTVGLAALLGIAMILSYAGRAVRAGEEIGFDLSVYTWMPAGMLRAAGVPADFTVDMGFFLDPLSCVMLFVVTFVGFWIHVYSVGYMDHEEGFQRFFTYLNLFMGAMLMLVLGNNYLVMFVGWEGVGLCSYLLIGFYYREEFPPYAGRKAFIVNRIGDFAFVIGLFALVANFGTLKFIELFPRIAMAAKTGAMQAPYHLGLTVAGFVALCLFVGAMGKSAQIPLYVWLPDAMAGPTPVSALIHAATMVTAGVYMVVRSNVIYQLAPGVSQFVAIIGALTAIFAGSIGIAQNDIKKVLAYSTVSQLGYMFLAAGLGAYTAAIFHLMTHAFFKALLFLGSGSVIHAMGGEQDMRKMGGLKKHMPVTYWTFLIGSIAIAGVPGFAGFFSKDQILGAAAERGQWALWGIGLFTAALTACYMFRAVFLTFHGEFRGTHEQEHHLHESPRVMTVPLQVLAVGAVFAGYVGIPKALTANRLDWNFFDRYLSRILVEGSGLAHHGGEPPDLGFELLLIGASIAAAFLGIGIAWAIWRRRGMAGEEAFVARIGPAHRVLANKYYVDEFYDKTFVRGTWGLARGLFGFDARVIDGFFVNGTANATRDFFSRASGLFDKFVVDGIVNLIGAILRSFSYLFRRLQTGLVANYALVLALGMFALVCIYFVLQRG